jgi:hypothetical protein
VSAVRWILALFLAWLGGPGVVGSILALVFEWQGFGTPRDQGVRVPYVLMYAALAVACAVAAVWVWRRLLPSAAGWGIAVVAASAGVGVVLLGLVA